MHQEKYVSTSEYLVHKSALTMLVLAGYRRPGRVLGGALPGGFIPQEDQGYLFVALQLPDAASLQRTDDAAQRVSQRSAQDARNRRRGGR